MGGLTASATDSLWNGNTNLWTTSGNWLAGIPGSGDNAVFGNVGIPTIDLGGNQTVGGIHFDGNIGFTITNNTLTIGSNGIRILGNGVVNLTDTISSSVVFSSSNPSISLNSLTTLALSGSTVTGTSFTQSGSGTMTITGAATFSSGATLSGGTLQIGSGGTSGSFSGNITNSGAVSFNRSDNLTYSGVISGSGSLSKSGAGTLILTGNNTSSGVTTINAGTVQLGSGGTSGALGGDITNNGGLTLNRSDNLTLSGAITGSGSLTQSGTGTLILSGTNSYSGGTTISSGTLQLGNGSTTGIVSGNITDNGVLIFNRSDNLTYSDVISGTGSLTQSGTGTLTLTNTNTYAAGTTISAGTLQIGNGGTVGLISGNISDNGALIFNRSDSITYSGIISGSGSVTQAGSSTLTLSGANSYLGGTKLNAGTVKFSASNNLGTGALTFNGGTLQWNSGNTTDISSRTVTINSGGATLNTGGNTITLVNGIGNSGSGALTKSGSGGLILTGANTYSGGTTVSGGYIQVGNGGTNGSISGNLTVNAGVIFKRSDNITFSGSIGGNGSGSIEQAGTGTLTLTNVSSASALFMYADGGGAITFSGPIAGDVGAVDAGSEAANGMTGTVNVDGATTVLTVGLMNVGIGGVGGTLNVTNGATLNSSYDLYAGSTSGSTNAAINVSGTNSAIVIAGALRLNYNSANSTGASLNLSSGGRLSATGLTGTGSVTVNTGTLGITSDASASNFISLNSGGGTIDVSSGATFTLSSAIGGTGALTKSGAGTLTLTNANAYSGVATVNGGTLKLGTNGRLGSGGVHSGNIAIGSGAILSYANSSNSQTLSGVISGAGTLAQDSTNDLILTTSTNNTVSNLSISGGRVFLNGSGSLGTIAAITLTGGILDFGNASLPAAPAIAMTFSSGAGIANRSLASGLTLNTTNQSFPASGIVSFNDDDAATNPIGVTGNYPTLTGNLEIQVGGTRVGSNAVGNVVLSGAISGSGGLTKSYTGTLILNGTNTYTGTTTISGGTVQLGDGTNNGSIPGDVVNNGTLIFRRSSSSYDFNGNISGSGNVIQNSSVTVRLGGTNTFTGGISVTGGTFTIGTGGATGSIVSNVNVGSTLIFNRNTDYAYAGNISGTGSVYKVNSNTLTLSGTNSYTNPTHLEGGLVNFTSLSNLGTSTLIMNGGGLQWASGTTTDISARTVLIDPGGGTLDTNGNNVTLANAIGNGGTGGLTKTGAGILTLSANPFYSGNTAISAGTLKMNGTLAASSAVTVGSGATLAGSGTISGTTTVSGPSGAYNAATASTINGSGLTLVGAVTVNGNATVSGTVTATNGLTANSGTLVVSGSISGSVIVNDTTRLQGSVSGNVLVNDAYTLLLTGSAGSLQVTGSSANFDPGSDSSGLPSTAGTGTINGSITLTSAPQFVISLGVTSSTDKTQLTMHSSGSLLTLNNAKLVLQLGNAYQHTDSQTFVIVDGTGSNGISGMFSQGSTITGANPSNPSITDQFTILYNVDATGLNSGKDIVLRAIPEPSAVTLLLAATGVLGIRRGTQRRK